jgi:hypothetical protein
MDDTERKRRKAAYQRDYYQRNRDRYREYHQKYHEANREKRRAYARAYYRRNKIKWRISDLARKYGLTVEDYERMAGQQSGLCAICSRRPNVAEDSETAILIVDHCHETGRVRGLLCGPCNRGIGHLADDTSRLRAAVEYLGGAR